MTLKHIPIWQDGTFKIRIRSICPGTAAGFPLLPQKDWTAIEKAAVLGRADELRRMLASRANSDTVTGDAFPLAHLAILGERTEVMGALVEAQVPYALHAAAALGVVPTIRAMVEAEIDVNELDSFGMTPLHYAALTGECEAVQCLLGHGADPNAADGCGWGALHMVGAAVIADEEPSSKVLFELVHVTKPPEVPRPPGKEVWALYPPSRQVHAELVRLLVRHGGSINAAASDGWTPLHVASHMGNPTAVRALLDAGAKTDVRNNFGQTPLDVAVQMANDCTRLLKDRALSGIIFRRTLWLPLKEQAEGIRTENVKIRSDMCSLLERQLYRAAIGDHEKVAAILVSAGAEEPGDASGALGN